MIKNIKTNQQYLQTAHDTLTASKYDGFIVCDDTKRIYYQSKNSTDKPIYIGGSDKWVEITSTAAQTLSGNMNFVRTANCSVLRLPTSTQDYPLAVGDTIKIYNTYDSGFTVKSFDQVVTYLTVSQENSLSTSFTFYWNGSNWQVLDEAGWANAGTKYLSALLSSVRSLTSSDSQPVIYMNALPSAQISDNTKYGIINVQSGTNLTTLGATSAVMPASAVVSVASAIASTYINNYVLSGGDWTTQTSTQFRINRLPSAGIGTWGITQINGSYAAANISGSSYPMAASAIYGWTSGMAAASSLYAKTATINNETVTAANNNLPFGEGWARVNDTTTGLVYKTGKNVYAAASGNAISAYLPSANIDGTYGIATLTNTINATDTKAATPSGVYAYTSASLTSVTINGSSGTLGDRTLDFGLSYVKLAKAEGGIAYKTANANTFSVYNSTTPIPSTYLASSVPFSTQINGEKKKVGSTANLVDLGTGWVNVASPTTNEFVYCSNATNGTYATSAFPSFTNFVSAITINGSSLTITNSAVDFGNGYCQIASNDTGVVRKTGLNTYSASAIGDSDIPVKYLTGVSINSVNGTVTDRVAALGNGWVNITSPSEGYVYYNGSSYITQALPGASTSQSGIVQLTGSISSGSDNTKAVTQAAVSSYCSAVVNNAGNYITGATINGSNVTVSNNVLAFSLSWAKLTKALGGVVYKTASSNTYGTYNSTTKIPSTYLPATVAFSGKINDKTVAVASNLLDFGTSFASAAIANVGIIYKTTTNTNAYSVYNSSSLVPANYLPSAGLASSTVSNNTWSNTAAWGISQIEGSTTSSVMSGSKLPIAASAVYAFVKDQDINSKVAGRLSGVKINGTKYTESAGNAVADLGNNFAVVTGSTAGQYVIKTETGYTTSAGIATLSSTYTPASTGANSGIITADGNAIPVMLKTNNGTLYPIEKGSLSASGSNFLIDVRPYVAYDYATGAGTGTIGGTWTVYYGAGINDIYTTANTIHSESPTTNSYNALFGTADVHVLTLTGNGQFTITCPAYNATNNPNGLPPGHGMIFKIDNSVGRTVKFGNSIIITAAGIYSFSVFNFGSGVERVGEVTTVIAYQAPA